MSEALHRYSPMPLAPATVRDLASQFIDDLLLRVQSGEYDSEACANVRRDLVDGGKLGKLTSLIACPIADAATIGQVPIGELTGQHLTKWLLANPQWASVHKRKAAIGAVRSMYAWAWAAFGLPCPIRQWPAVTRQKAPTRREASAAEYITLMHKGSRPLRRALYLLWNTGCRPKEMRLLEWSDVLFAEAVIDTENNKTLRATGENRVIGLEPRLVRLLRNLHRQRSPFTELVFTNTDGTAWDRHTFARHLRRTAKRIGLDKGVDKRVSAYCIRHTYITDADEAGVDRARISYQSGHSNPKTIETYSKARRKRRNARRVAGEIAAKRRRFRKNPDQGQFWD
jgi:integrase